MTIDVDSTIREVHGTHQRGASYGYSEVVGFHPRLATRADTGEVRHPRVRKGSSNTQRGAQRFVRGVVGRVRRAGGQLMRVCSTASRCIGWAANGANVPHLTHR
jgi:hypothetical protein